MIHTKQDLYYYLSEDLKASGNDKPKLKDWILHNEKYFRYSLLKELRYVEFYKNSQQGVLGYLIYCWHMLRFKRFCWKCKCIVNPNTCGPGLYIAHLGSFTYIRKGSKIGRNFTIICGCVLGKQKDDNLERIEIGDNCFAGINVTILGNVKIGNNVTIGAHALVVKDVPDNCIIGGCPARIIRMIDYDK